MIIIVTRCARNVQRNDAEGAATAAEKTDYSNAYWIWNMYLRHDITRAVFNSEYSYGKHCDRFFFSKLAKMSIQTWTV